MTFTIVALALLAIPGLGPSPIFDGTLADTLAGLVLGAALVVIALVVSAFAENASEVGQPDAYQTRPRHT